MACAPLEVKNESSNGERVVRESAWCAMVGLGLASALPEMYTVAAQARCASVPALVCISFPGGDPPPPLVYSYQISGDLIFVVRIACSWPLTIPL